MERGSELCSVKERTGELRSWKSHPFEGKKTLLKNSLEL